MIITVAFLCQANARDYSPLSLESLSFLPGAADGTEVCTPIAIVSDNLVECEENFGLILTLVTSGASISLGSSVSTVTLLDSDGKQPCMCASF
jgi:hypothetical protein